MSRMAARSGTLNAARIRADWRLTRPADAIGLESVMDSSPSFTVVARTQWISTH
jgi:hypothetical protein